MLSPQAPPPGTLIGPVLDQVARYPRFRYMGSKYKVLPHLVAVFSELEFESALDAFSGSGVVGYALKAMGKQVVANDFLHFPATVAKATIENRASQLDANDIESILRPHPGASDFIQRTFQGLYFPPADLEFLDNAWAHIDEMPVYKREVAISALCLAAARKQPRGVFTITSFRYDDGRRSLRLPLSDIFREAAQELNTVVFDNGRRSLALCQDVFEVEADNFDLVYLDPPYAPPRDDNDYIKRYHFLEGLSVYWRGQDIMEDTATKKLRKRFTPFAYKRTIREALRGLFDRFHRSTIVLSYSSNSVPSRDEIYELLSDVKSEVKMFAVPYRYSFGTHTAATRREVEEYIFIGR